MTKFIDNINDIDIKTVKYKNIDAYVNNNSYDSVINNVSDVQILDLDSNLNNNDLNFFERINDIYNNTRATMVVGEIKIFAGILDISEHLIDGLIWTGAKLDEGTSRLAALIAGIFSDDYKEDILSNMNYNQEKYRNIIDYDVVDNIEDSFFSTRLGSKINDDSYMKYDSDTANKIENVSTEIGEFALATGATIVTGGIAAPLALGFLSGTGEQADKVYSELNSFTGAKETGIFFSGLAEGTLWAAKGRLGNSVIDTANILSGISANSSSVSLDSIMNYLKSAVSSRRHRGLKGFIERTFRRGVDVADVANGIFEPIANSLNNNISFKETGAKIGFNTVQNMLSNYLFNGFDVYFDTFRFASFDGLDSRIVSLCKNFMDLIDSGEDSIGLVDNQIDKGFDKIIGIDGKE